MMLRRGLWLSICVMATALRAADAQTPGTITGKTAPLVVDFGDAALNTGARGAIVGRTTPLVVTFP